MTLSSTHLPWCTTLAAACVLAWSLTRARADAALLSAEAPAGARLDAPALLAAGATGAPTATPASASGAEVELELPPAGGEIDFAWLEFASYDPPALRSAEGALEAADFPPRARALNGRRITLIGFPLVTGGDGDQVRELLLTRFPPGCCFGAVPVFDEWAFVTLDEPVRARDLPRRVAVEGLLEVGEELDELGEPLSLYRLRAESLREN